MISVIGQDKDLRRQGVHVEIALSVARGMKARAAAYGVPLWELYERVCREYLGRQKEESSVEDGDEKK